MTLFTCIVLRKVRPDAFNEGLDNNSLVKYAAEHWYQHDGTSGSTLNLQGTATMMYTLYKGQQRLILPPQI